MEVVTGSEKERGEIIESKWKEKTIKDTVSWRQKMINDFAFKFWRLYVARKKEIESEFHRQVVREKLEWNIRLPQANSILKRWD